MAEPPHTLSGQRRDEIRRVAAQLFEASGYSATTMNNIADAVGVLPGSLYHHFESKEEIAVEILGELNRELGDLASRVTGRLGGKGEAPRERLLHLAREVTSLSYRHGAALRLYAYQAPRASTERFHSALRLQAPALERAWKRAVDELLAGQHHSSPQDLVLLRFALHRLTLNAAINAPEHPDPAAVARQVCDLLVDGLTPDCPDDRELDASEAMSAAREAIAAWRPLETPTGSGSRSDIVAVARAEFATRGFSATTVRDVAEAAGVRMGTLYRRVRSKDEILREILDAYTSDLEDAVRSVLTTGTSAPASLDALALVFVHAKRRFRQESDIVKFGWRGRESEDSPFHAYYRQTQNRLRLLEQLLSRGVAHGTVRTIGAPAEIAPHLRTIIWLPYQDCGRTSARRAHRFLRRSLLRGALEAGG